MFNSMSLYLDCIYTLFTELLYLPLTMAQRFALNRADHYFLHKAAKGSQVEVQLAKLGELKAMQPAVSRLSRLIATDYLRVQPHLQVIARQKRIKLPVLPDWEDRMALRKLAQLSDETFDREFVTYALAFNQKKRQLYEGVLRGGMSPIVRQFARGAIPILEAQVLMTQRVQRNEG